MNLDKFDLAILKVLQDNARQTVRPDELGLDAEQCALAAARPPLRVLVDGRLRVPPDAAFFQAGAALVACAAEAAAAEALRAQGHEVRVLPAGDGHVALEALLRLLGERGANEVLVEAGPRLAGAFARAGLVDEYQIFVAPKLLGSSARPLLDWPLQQMAEAPALQIDDIRAFGDDWRIRAVPRPLVGPQGPTTPLSRKTPRLGSAVPCVPSAGPGSDPERLWPR